MIAELAEAAGPDALLTDPADCWPYGYDNSRRQGLPQAVVFARDHDQVAAVVRLCHERNLALISRGTGTGTTGATVPLDGGVVLSFERMNRILEVDPANRLARVEPGVRNRDLQDAAAVHGLFWPPDPTSAAICTVGGNLAYNSAGPRAVKYGTARENTLGLRAVTGTGASMRTGTLTTKGVVGYDLTRLLVGSEGTLAVITEAVLKLTPLPEAIRTLQATYRDLRAAAEAVSAIMAQPLLPCALEFMDATAVDILRRQAGLPLPPDCRALLMIEVDGPREALEQSAGRVAEAAAVDGLIAVTTAHTPGEAQELWETRKALSPALRRIAPKKINEDVAVPVSRIPELVDGLDALSRRHAITIVNFGHAGNGNIHVNLLVDPGDPRQMDAAARCLDETFELVLRLGGTLSGEHGVGLEKRDYVAREIDPVALGLMHAIKDQFDPKGILNPGKCLPRPC
ncbi:MAG: FAD-linked oxidase C-terminal domain-containing protein [Pseudomonadota bacterium]